MHPYCGDANPRGFLPATKKSAVYRRCDCPSERAPRMRARYRMQEQVSGPRMIGGLRRATRQPCWGWRHWRGGFGRMARLRLQRHKRNEETEEHPRATWTRLTSNQQNNTNANQHRTAANQSLREETVFSPNAMYSPLLLGAMSDRQHRPTSHAESTM